MVCLKCGKVMKCSKTSALGFELHERIMVTDDLPAKVKKVKCVRYCDFYKCPDCETEIATNFAQDPVAQDHEPEAIAAYLRDSADLFKGRFIFFVA